VQQVRCRRGVRIKWTKHNTTTERKGNLPIAIVRLLNEVVDNGEEHEGGHYCVPCHEIGGIVEGDLARANRSESTTLSDRYPDPRRADTGHSAEWALSLIAGDRRSVSLARGVGCD
jgi:hypothetical protein